MKFFITTLIFLTFLGGISAKKVKYKVKKGDTLLKIAYKYLKKSKFIYPLNLASEIKKNNGIKKYLKIGQILEIEITDKPLIPKKRVVDKNFIVKGLYYPTAVVAYKNFLSKMDSFKKVGINSVVIDIKTMTGEITIPFNNKIKKSIKKNGWVSLGDLNKLIYYLHKKGFHTIARITCFHDEALANGKPEYRLYKKGRYKYWVDPRNKEVQNYLLDLIETVLKYPVDEIQLDYVRFPETGSKVCKKQKRVETITNFIKKVKKLTKKYKTLLSLDVFGITLWQRKIDLCVTGQNLPLISKYADILSPMIYPSHFSNPFDGVKNPGDNPEIMINKSMERAKKILNNSDIVVRPYLQAFAYGTKKTPYNHKYILKQVKNLKKGYLFWNARGKYGVVLNAQKILTKKNNKKKEKVNRNIKKSE